MRDMGPVLDEIRQLKEERDSWRRVAERLEREKQELIAFARKVLQTAFDGCSLDGGEIQELGVKYSLLKEEPYDPEKHGENSDFELGDQFYAYSDILKVTGFNNIDSTE